MFWKKKPATKVGAPGSDPRTREPLINPANGQPLAPKDHPGYYPGFSTLSQQKYWDAATRELIHKRVSESTPIRFFRPRKPAPWPPWSIASFPRKTAPNPTA